MLPVTLLTGFLGSGKTSLLRRLLASPFGRGIGVLLNERGVAGIDDVGGAEAGLVELSEGCVCCVDQPDLEVALQKLGGRAGIERIVLETSGLADPLPIAWALSRPDLASRVFLESVVAALDAENHQKTEVEEWAAQLRAADVVVLTKLDLVSPAQAERARATAREVSPGARVLDAADALVALAGAEAFFGRADAPLASRPAGAAAPLPGHGDFATVVFAGDAVYRADPLEDLVSDLPPAVFRAKGIARLEDGGWMAFQAVGGRPHLELDAAAPPHGESRLAFFGHRLERSALEARLAACRASPAR